MNRLLAILAATTFVGLACGSQPQVDLAAKPVATQVADVTPVAGPTAAQSIVPVRVTVTPAPVVAPEPAVISTPAAVKPDPAVKSVAPACPWVAPSGGVVTLQGGIGGPYSTTQHSLPAPICVNFTGKVEYDRPFADSFAHPLRTLTGSQMVDRWVLANGTASWVLADFGYVRG